MIGALLLAPLAILCMDWALWERIDTAISRPPFARQPWRMTQRRWVAPGLVVVWCALVAFRHGQPSGSIDDGAGRVLLIAGVALLAWWFLSIWRDLHDPA